MKVGLLNVAYLYWFTWQTPVLNGRPRAFHCLELAFVFDKTDRRDTKMSYKSCRV